MNTSTLIAGNNARRWTVSLMTITIAALLPSSSYAQQSNCPRAPNEPEVPECRPPVSPYKAIRFQGDYGSFLRVRKSVFELTPYEVDRLRYAFGALRRLSVEDPSDPRGWMMQANVHCWNCAGAAPPHGAGIDVHGHYWFLPWHRAYLYFFEKILGELIGEPDFALPYWDWDTEGRSRLPPLYNTPANVIDNPLYDSTRHGTDRCMPVQFMGPKVVNDVMTITDWELFMGKEAPLVPSGPVDPRKPPPTAGRFENTLHNIVHGWVPAAPPPPPPDQPTQNCGAPNMGIFSTSAQDPIFFAHHANVDRLWETWWRAGGEQRLPPDERWRRETFQFFDEHGHLVEISVQQLVEVTGSLGYTYSPPSAAGDAVTCPSAAMGAMEMALLAPPAASLVNVTPGAPNRLTSQPQTVAAPVRGTTPAVGFFEPAGALMAQREPRLHIDGVTLPPGQTATVRVLLHDPSAPALTSSAPVDETYFSIIPHHSSHALVQNVEIPLGPQAQQLLLPTAPPGLAMSYVEQPLLVTLVPTTPGGEPQALAPGYAAFGAMAAATVLDYRDIYITR
ncbi:tyrosinase family protein [Sorangium sp. So ce233]|uniref:tyrosinase family protein n=1 Tax=Sorangium sp. So ce233 TaxID=3133290 RepID=UPI003F605DEF